MATVSKVFVANLALSLLGTKSRIESLTESSREAHEMDLWYDLTRKNLMERFDWGFCRKRDHLALDDEQELPAKWAYRYIYPADCLKARAIEYPGQTNTSLRYSGNHLQAPTIPYLVEESPDGTHRTLLTNMENAVLVYTRNLDDPSRYPTGFITLLATWLATNTAYNITGKAAIADKMAAAGERAFVMAAAADANEEVAVPEKDADWIVGRC